jgi:hypothetical protein
MIKFFSLSFVLYYFSLFVIVLTQYGYAITPKNMEVIQSETSFWNSILLSVCKIAYKRAIEYSVVSICALFPFCQLYDFRLTHINTFFNCKFCFVVITNVLIWII